MFNKISPAIIAIIVALSTVSGVNLVYAETIEELQAKISGLSAKSQNLDQRSREYRSLISETKEEARTLQGDIGNLSAEINALEAEIGQTETNIESTGYKIQLTELEAQKTHDKIEVQRGQLAEVLRVIHNQESASLLEIMLLQPSFAAFLNEREQVLALQDSLKAFNDELKQRKSDLEAAAAALTREKANLEALNVKLGIQQTAITGQKSQKSRLLATTKGQEREYQQMLAGVEAEKAALLKEVKILEQRVVAQRNFLKYAEAKTIPPKGTKIFIWPEANYKFTQGYGMTAYAKRGAYGGSPHNGIDISHGAGTPLLAAADGVVFASGTNKGWGNWIALQHANGLVTLYGHMIKPTHQSVGRGVTAGTTIGYEGATGFSTGSHLHFSVYEKFFTYDKGNEVYFNYFDGTLNPLDYL